MVRSDLLRTETKWGRRGHDHDHMAGHCYRTDGGTWHHHHPFSAVHAFPGIPEAIAIAAIVVLHVWKRNMLLSIAGGTVVYMALLQLVFA